MTITLQNKPNGERYVVVLRSPDFSMGRIAAMGALGGKGRFPVPLFDDRCICCDLPATTAIDFDASTDRLKVDPIKVPTCFECWHHVPKSTTKAQLIGAAFCVVIGAGIYGAAQDITMLWVGSAVVFAALVAYILLQRSRVRARAADGHHVWLEILVSAGQCAVHTNNRRVAQGIVERQEPLVHRAR